MALAVQLEQLLSKLAPWVPQPLTSRGVVADADAAAEVDAVVAAVGVVLGQLRSLRS